MIKVGILGTGFGETHLELYSKIEGFQVVSIFGRNLEKLSNIRKKHGIHVTTDINEVIEDPDIDLIDVCLPTDLHAKWTIESLKNEKHVFCETPVTYTVDEAMAIQLASLKHNKNVFVNLFIKFSAPHKLAMELIRSGECGNLIGIKSYNKTPPWWGDLGLQKNVESFHNHMMDFVIEIAGIPKSVTASGKDFGGKSIVTSILKYTDIYAVLESISAMPECSAFEIGFELLCTEGVIRFDAAYSDEYTKVDFTIERNGKTRDIVEFMESDDYEEVLRHVLDCLHSGEKSKFIDIETAVKTVELKEMIISSLGLI